MVRANLKRKALKKKLCEEKERLSKMHLITTSQELDIALTELDCENISVAKNTAKKLTLLKTQVQIRKKVLNQIVPITFTCSRKNRPLSDIVQELSNFIDQNNT